MKGIATDIHHKTEAGLVVLGVEGPEAAGETFRLLQERAKGKLEAVLVEQMIAGNRELMVGMKRDSVFGPVVAFGLGGVLTEALGDVVLALAPVDDVEAADLPGLIRAKRLLGSFRGYPAVEQAALAKIIQAIGQMAVDNPEITEIDVNPVLIQGDSPIAADALIILGPPPEEKKRDRRAFKPNMAALLAPRSIAVVGASGDVGKWGGSALCSILDGGYEGKVYPVNPKGGVFFGLQAYASIEDLPEVPDLALLAVSQKQVVPVLHECVRKRVGAVIVMAAGYSETGEAGAEAEREIARIATEGWVTLMGPNCMGMISNEVGLHAVGFVKLHPPKGTLSFVSQSGNMGVTTTGICQRRGIGIDKFASVGNEAQIGAVDILDYLRDDPNTTCVMMYIEGVDDGRRFLEVAKRTTAVKPVVVLRAGVTEYGSKAAASHTGAMAGSAAVWEAAARQAGVVTCTSPEEVVDLGTCLAYLPLPKGRRIAIITQGGGAGVLAADEVARHGLTLAELPAELYASLDPLLPPFWSKQNPLDLVASGGGDVAPQVLRAVVECDAVDAVLALSLLGVPAISDGQRAITAAGEFAGLTSWEDSLLALVAELMESTGKPIIIVPDSPILGSVFDYGKKYRPIVLSSSRAAAHGPRSHGMVCGAPARPQPLVIGGGDMADKTTTAEAVEILSGNEAIARGAWEAGVKLAAAYPGTPSTEILETLAEYEDVYCEWSPNEKVAMEVGVGASIAGARTLVCMKHVGLNVAADPFFSASYVGVEGGLVVVSADDPGMHSSQDEQDNRNYAKFTRVPLVEPSDSAEAREFTVAAFELSERFDTPVMLRMTTRTSHSKSLVELGERQEPKPVTELKRDWTKYIMMPANARVRHRIVEQRLLDLAEYAETCPFNRVEMGDPEVGIITSGAIYGYAREALPGASFLKIGMTFPLPKKLIADFRSKVDKLYVVEESDPFMEEAIRLMGIKIDGGKELNSLLGELDARLVAQVAGQGRRPGCEPRPAPRDLDSETADLPDRPPTFCPGCSHRGVFVILKKLRVVRERRHRLLHHGCLASLQRATLPDLHGRQHKHGSRSHQGTRAAGGGGQARSTQQSGGGHRRQHLLPLRDHLAHGRGLQPRYLGVADPGQQHHGHDRRPGEPGHRQDPAGRSRGGGRHPGSVQGYRHQARDRRWTRTISRTSSAYCAKSWRRASPRWSSPRRRACSSSRSRSRSTRSTRNSAPAASTASRRVVEP